MTLFINAKGVLTPTPKRTLKDKVLRRRKDLFKGIAQYHPVAGECYDQILSEVSGLSLTECRRRIKNKAVKVGGFLVTPNETVEEGNCSITMPITWSKNGGDIAILYFNKGRL